MKVGDYLKLKYSRPDRDILKTKIDLLYDDKSYDTYFSEDYGIEKLIEAYKTYGYIIIAYDFDDTIKPKDNNVSCDLVTNLLQLCSQTDLIMICYTARGDWNSINDAKDYLDKVNIRYDYINADSDKSKEFMEYSAPHKVLYNIFLDDKAGLKSAYNILRGFMKWYLKQQLTDGGE